MNKKTKILITLLFLVLFIILGTNKCNAGLYMNNLDFNVQINQDGSMNVTEDWDISISETNTLFKTFKTDSTKYSSISNVEVTEITDGTEKDFKEIDSLMYHVTKDCYYGLENGDGDFEIAWGVGLDDTRADKRYKISYKVNDAIAKYQDNAELYWQFVGSDFDISCDKVTGTILLPQNATSKEDIKVWGHTEGLNGEIYATASNKIEFEVNEFRSGRYIEIRTLFPTSIISTSGRTYSKDRLDEVISEETVWAEEANRKRKQEENAARAATVIFVVCVAGFDFLILKSAIKIRRKTEGKEKFKPSQELEYFREVPRKNATPAQAIYIYNEIISNVATNQMGNIFSATLLDLCLKKYIDFEENSSDKKNIIIKILKNQADDNLEKTEKLIFEYIVKASKGNSQITIKDVEKYMKKYASKLIDLKDDVEKASVKELQTNELYDEKEAIEKSQCNTGLFFNIVMIFVILFVAVGLLPAFLINGSIVLIGVSSAIVLYVFRALSLRRYAKRINVYTQKGIDEKQMWKGLKKYMEDFSMLDKREIPEIVIWEQFLVYATAFGIADKVIKQLKAVYKELGRSFEFDDSSYGYMYFMMNNDFSSSFTNSVSSAFTSAYDSNYASSSYSSGSGGGGGFSGGGGGGRWPEEAEVVDKSTSTFKSLQFREGSKILELSLFNCEFSLLYLRKKIKEKRKNDEYKNNQKYKRSKLHNTCRNISCR